MSRKGLSVDEKRKRIQKIFHETGEFYQLKDIEKLGPKRGVVTQSVKDVLMSLVDDGLVTMDKIGTSNYFWSYPSAAIQSLINEEERQKRLQNEISEAKETRQDTEERQKVLMELKEAKERNEELEKELSKYKENDPVLHEKKEKAAKIAKEAANRWTENIWEIESYCVNNYNMDRTVFKQSFDIPEDLDVLN
ncbi:hypothetical protein RO3G_02545 [Rhizopus delemar RA 99-880]|uniref:Meiotic nuclear division protein 1 n=1 Tax=Rhizopus delemar (strain RA 99-880 / ATCC MYA-4621 / FGSC 9543 / NRRL 43880) TaxID=246409 RepID=I1BNR1_RHIO9|nr:hypothetical protein RO3G_02545 [Rhizopus delemar RA 99-880]|eukprot:EIE77841.1 hypothetical protein RO3G_02545 [Rhizopus delemar RA 99-880]